MLPTVLFVRASFANSISVQYILLVPTGKKTDCEKDLPVKRHRGEPGAGTHTGLIGKKTPGGAGTHTEQKRDKWDKRAHGSHRRTSQPSKPMSKPNDTKDSL